MNAKLLKGNNIDLLKTLDNNSIDSVVTDPPYGLQFMNKKWDYDVPSVEFWKEVYRVLKPGGHILSFGGTRTYHRMVVNIEDAGFEIRDCIQWIYGSGFPKSLNVGKAVDKLEGNEREEYIDEDFLRRNPSKNNNGILQLGLKDGIDAAKRTKGQTQWEGWGTGLKPANEPIVLVRKPLDEKTIVENVLEWGTGGINIDGCRVGNDEGRFPSNVILECTCDEVIKGEKGEIKQFHRKESGSVYGGGKGLGDVKGNYISGDKGDIHTNPECPCYIMDEQSDGASRFFYQAKVSKKERNLGLDDSFYKPTLSYVNGQAYQSTIIVQKKNTHPTVKPINLLTYLIRMVTPPNGVILDPFMGSGSSGIAALLEDKSFVGMEMEDEYFNIAEARINNYEEYRKLLK